MLCANTTCKEVRNCALPYESRCPEFNRREGFESQNSIGERKRFVEFMGMDDQKTKE